MSSLINKIQKSSSRRDDDVNRVIISGESGGVSNLNTTGLSDKFKLIKSARSNDEDLTAYNYDESSWLSSRGSIPTEVSMLLNTALKVIEEIWSENSQTRVDHDLMLSTALERARRIHSGEFTISRYDLAFAEHELRELLKGYGPLRGLLNDRLISEVFIDNFQSISVRKENKILSTPVSFKSPLEYKLFLTFLENRASKQHSSISSCKQFIIRGEQILRCSVLNSIGSSKEDPRLCIRVSRPRQVSFYDLLRDKFLPAGVASWLTDLSSSGLANVLIVGAPQSSKSRLACALLNAAPSDERIITVEELPEIKLAHTGHESLVIQEINREQGAADLLHCAMQRAPHRIALDELKGLEAAAYLSVLEQGLQGSVTTVSASSVREGLWKFADLVLRADLSPESSIIRRIERAIKIVLKTSIENGEPVLSGIYELVPSPRAPFTAREIVRFAGRKDDKRQWLICAQENPSSKRA